MNVINLTNFKEKMLILKVKLQLQLTRLLTKKRVSMTSKKPYQFLVGGFITPLMATSDFGDISFGLIVLCIIGGVAMIGALFGLERDSQWAEGYLEEEDPTNPYLNRNIKQEINKDEMQIKPKTDKSDEPGFFRSILEDRWWWVEHVEPWGEKSKQAAAEKIKEEVEEKVKNAVEARKRAEIEENSWVSKWWNEKQKAIKQEQEDAALLGKKKESSWWDINAYLSPGPPTQEEKAAEYIWDTYIASWWRRKPSAKVASKESEIVAQKNSVQIASEEVKLEVGSSSGFKQALTDFIKDRWWWVEHVEPWGEKSKQAAAEKIKEEVEEKVKNAVEARKRAEIEENSWVSKWWAEKQKIKHKPKPVGEQWDAGANENKTWWGSIRSYIKEKWNAEPTTQEEKAAEYIWDTYIASWWRSKPEDQTKKKMSSDKSDDSPKTFRGILKEWLEDRWWWVEHVQPWKDRRAKKNTDLKKETGDSSSSGTTGTIEDKIVWWVEDKLDEYKKKNGFRRTPNEPWSVSSDDEEDSQTDDDEEDSQVNDDDDEDSQTDDDEK